MRLKSVADRVKVAEGTFSALKVDNEEKDKLIRTLFKLVEARKTIEPDHNESIKGEGTCVTVRINHDEFDTSKCRGKWF